MNKSSLLLVIFLIFTTNIINCTSIKNLKKKIKPQDKESKKEVEMPEYVDDGMPPKHCEHILNNVELPVEEIFQEHTKCHKVFCRTHQETKFCKKNSVLYKEQDLYGYPTHCDKVYSNAELTMNEMFTELIKCQDFYCIEHSHKGFCEELAHGISQEDKEAEAIKIKKEALKAKKIAEELRKKLMGPELPDCKIGDGKCVEKFCNEFTENLWCKENKAVQIAKKHYGYPKKCNTSENYTDCIVAHCEQNPQLGYCKDKSIYGYPYHCNEANDYFKCITYYCKDEENNDKKFCNGIKMFSN